MCESFIIESFIKVFLCFVDFNWVIFFFLNRITEGREYDVLIVLDLEFYLNGIDGL